MIEIIFRGKKKFYNDFAYGFYLEKNDGKVFLIMDENMDTYHIIPETVGQFIGVHDKGGKKLFDGDIVEAWSQGSKGRFVIKYRLDGGGTPCYILYPAWHNGEMWSISSSKESDGKYYDRGIEVIGNIHEHKNLLGGEVD